MHIAWADSETPYDGLIRVAFVTDKFAGSITEHTMQMARSDHKLARNDALGWLC